MTAINFHKSKAPLILDGGIGTEIQRRGVRMDKSAWSATAHWHYPQVICQLHKDYINAGADIITTNTFHCAKHILKTIGMEKKTIDINRSAVDLACQARRESDKPIIIAGSMSTIPSLDNPVDMPRGKEIDNNFIEQAHCLAESGVDVILCEMLMDSESALRLIEAAATTGLPVWAGVSASQNPQCKDGLMAFRTPEKYQCLKNEDFRHLVKTISTAKICAMGVMHTKLEAIGTALALLQEYWSGQTMAYAEIGHFKHKHWEFDARIDADFYTNQALNWIDEYNLAIVGGCCGTTVSHIEHLSDATKKGQRGFST